MPETLPQANRGWSLLCIFAPTCGLALALEHNVRHVGRLMHLMADLLRQNWAPPEIARWYAMEDARLVQAVAEAVFAVLLAALAVQLVLRDRLAWA